jgi:hypothetical protein
MKDEAEQGMESGASTVLGSAKISVDEQNPVLFSGG